MSDVARRWAAASATLALAPASVDVWLAFCPPDGPAPALEAVLSVDERERAGRFVFARDRRRFVAARGLLRGVLARYLAIAAAEVRFTYAAHGKPMLADEHAPRLDFNVSHSEEAVVIAVSHAGPVGVDVEAIRTMADRDDIARRTFAPGEFSRLCLVDEGRRTEAFFNCWTRKEAFVKALGEGLSHPLERFEVTLDPGEPAGLLHIDGDAVRAECWTFVTLPQVRGFATALIVKGHPTVSCFQCSNEPAATIVAAANERCIA